MRPENASRPLDALNAFRGIAFSIVPVPPNKVYLAIDMLTRYVSRLSIADYRNQKREAELYQHCSVAFEKRRWLVRDNGLVKYRCIYAGDTGKSISEVQIEDLGVTVLEYYQQKFPEISNASDQMIPPSFAHATSVIKILCRPCQQIVPNISVERDFRHKYYVRPQLSPDERQNALRQFTSELGL